MEHAAFLQDLAILMLTAGIATLLFHRLKQPVVLGYLLAGMLIGPHTPPFPLITDEEAIKTLSELGVIFLMFSLGLEFSLRKLKQVGSTAFIAAILEIILMIVIGYEIGRFFQWSQMDSLFLGAILAISSSTIILKALDGLGRSREPFAQYVFGILIVEDILAIVILALLSGVAVTGALEAGAVAATVGQLSLFLVLVLVFGLLLVPRFIHYVARTGSDEMLLITVLSLCFGVSLLAVDLGYSVALGAFLIGAVIAEARVIGRIESLMKPVRDMFSAIFFVSIGLLIDPDLLLEYWVPILVITVAVILGKVATCSIGTFLAGHSIQTSLRVGMSLAQIGEFSFIIASLGVTLGVTSHFLYPIAVMVSVLTTWFTPYLIQGADPAVAWFERSAPPGLLRALDLYTGWIQKLTAPGEENLFLDTAKRMFWRIVLNLFLVAGFLVAARFAAGAIESRVSDFPGGPPAIRTVCWAVAMAASSFLFLATYRKLDILSVFMGEVAAGLSTDPQVAAAIRRWITLLVFWGGSLAIAGLIFFLSVSILPSWQIVGLVGTALAILIILFREKLVSLYLAGQQAIEETFSAPKDHSHGESHDSASLRPVEASVQMIRETIPTGHPAIGMSLAELNLTARPGPMIVGISRGTHTVLYPYPEEQLQPGDELAIVGSPGQIEFARNSLAQPRI
ncbi:MAG: cation:proton antiporter [Candidatus Methylacidiphilales bacterium]